MSLISSNKIKIEGGMSSATDLIFLMLIFFIILSALAKNTVEDVDLPQGGSASPSKQSKAIVGIKADNTITLNNKPVSIEKLGRALLLAVDKQKPEDKIVEVNGDKVADYGIVVKIIDVAKKNKLKVVLMSKK
ncbi:MAG: ExbD/TolR family protein [Flavobacteriales bacterium]